MTEIADARMTKLGQEADPLENATATDALVAALESYLPPTTERGQRLERLGKLVAALAAKSCSNAEIVRVLKNRGVRTSWRTVKRLRPKAGVHPVSSVDAIRPDVRQPQQQQQQASGELRTVKI